MLDPSPVKRGKGGHSESNVQMLNLRLMLLLQSGLVAGLGKSTRVSQAGSSVASIAILSCVQCGLLVCSEV